MPLDHPFGYRQKIGRKWHAAELGRREDRGVKTHSLRRYCTSYFVLVTFVRFVGNLVLRSGLSDPPPPVRTEWYGGASSTTLHRVTEQHGPNLEFRAPAWAGSRGRHDRRGSMGGLRGDEEPHTRAQVATHAPGRLIIIVSTKMSRPLSLSPSRANFGPNPARQTWRAV